jgi:hypothetical protein
MFQSWTGISSLGHKFECPKRRKLYLFDLIQMCWIGSSTKKNSTRPKSMLCFVLMLKHTSANAECANKASEVTPVGPPRTAAPPKRLKADVRLKKIKMRC